MVRNCPSEFASGIITGAGEWPGVSGVFAWIEIGNTERLRCKEHASRGKSRWNRTAITNYSYLSRENQPNMQQLYNIQTSGASDQSSSSVSYGTQLATLFVETLNLLGNSHVHVTLHMSSY